MAFTSRTLQEWADIHGWQRRNWIYRGHQDGQWKLRTTLERCCERHAIHAHKRAIEDELFREFRRAYHHHAVHVPDPRSKIEWFSLMQHYGAPTRLLDFTFSVYVAVYFATEFASVTEGAKTPAVWAVNLDWVTKASRGILQSQQWAPKHLEAISARLEGEEAEHRFNDRLMQVGDNGTRAALPINPFRLNERLQVQKGLFLIPIDVEAPFEDNLRMPGYEDPENVVRLDLPPNFAIEARARVFDMNITRRSLFPGLAGYAESLGVYHPIFSNVTR